MGKVCFFHQWWIWFRRFFCIFYLFVFISRKFRLSMFILLHVTGMDSLKVLLIILFENLVFYLYSNTVVCTDCLLVYQKVFKILHIFISSLSNKINSQRNFADLCKKRYFCPENWMWLPILWPLDLDNYRYVVIVPYSCYPLKIIDDFFVEISFKTIFIYKFIPEFSTCPFKRIQTSVGSIVNKVIFFSPPLCKGLH